MKSSYRLLLFCAFALLLFITSKSYSQFSVWKKQFNGQGLSVGINPINPNTIYSQANDNRIWVSRDRGTSWSSLPVIMPSLLREILVHPKDTATIFAVNFFEGLRRSTNGGISWQIVLNSYGIDGESFGYDPLHPDTMYAGNFQDAAIFRSTDRGTTWTLKGHAGSSGLCGLAIRPDSADILLAGSGNGQISKSTNQGQNWHLVKPGGSQEIPKIVIDPVNPQIAYGSAYSGLLSSDGVWKTTDGGEHWALTALASKSMWSLDIDPRHPNILYAGTFDEVDAAVYWTTDGGASWADLDKGFPQNNAMWNLKVDPLDSSNIYVGVTVGAFGANGVYKLANANAGIEGVVRDSLTGQPIVTGSLVINPGANVYSLGFTGGVFGFYRFNGDTTSIVTENVTINSALFKTQQISLVNDSILQKDIIVQPGEISGDIFNDLNLNGVRDGGEPGLADWVLQVTGQKNASIHSDSTGHFVISDLFPGTDTVREQTRLGWVQTHPTPSNYTLTISMANKFYPGRDFGNHVGHHVVSIVPAPNSNNVSRPGVVHAVFDTMMDVTQFNDTSSWIVSGSSSGRHRGSFIFGSGDTSVTFTPIDSFQAGEVVSLDLSTKLKAAGGAAFTPYGGQFTTGVPASNGTLLPRRDYNVGSGPWAVAIADLNNDGFNDIVAASPGSSVASVLINNGDGTFAPAVPYPTGSGARAVALGDIDNDGDIDVVVANNGFTTVTVLKNNGNGTLAAKVDYAAGGNPSSVSLGDLDGDGYPDIVSTNTTSNVIAVLNNDGAGNFSAPHPYPSGNQPWWSTVADINRDGGLDVLVANALSTSTVSFLSNIGAGKVALQTSYTVGGFARAIAAADFTNDGRMDLVAANSSSTSVSVYRQDVAGNYPTRTDVATGAGPWGVATGDLDGDGYVDVCVVNATANNLSVLKNMSGTSFSRTDYATGLNPRGVAVADLDGDGDLDVVVANSGDGTVSVFRNSIFTMSIAGWNLVSVPVRPLSFAKTAVYPYAVSRAFAYVGGYIARDTLTNGTGYWVKIDSVQPVGYNGQRVLNDTLHVTTGWNLIGTLAQSVSTGSVVANPPGIVSSPYFGYNGSYYVASSLDPGAGYWVKLKGDGTLVLNASPAQQPMAKAGGKNELELFSTLSIEDSRAYRQTLYFSSNPECRPLVSSYEVPPLPPEQSFDIRFASQRLAEAAGSEGPESFAIRVSNAAYPLTLNWSVRDDESRRWSVVSGGVSRNLAGRGKSVVAAPATGTESTIFLKAAAAGHTPLPSEFSLGQNYPNPFNPSTQIRYQLSAEGRVTLTIHNLLGQEVARLIDSDHPAGYYTAHWDAANAPSGVYYARLKVSSKAGERLYEATQKLVVMR